MLSIQRHSGRLLGLWIRSYGSETLAHSHDFAQLVLPLQGTLEIDFRGRAALLDRTLAAYVPEGTLHEQMSRSDNRFLIVDVLTEGMDAELSERLSERSFLPVSPTAAHLIDYMADSLPKGSTLERATLWTPLLLDALLEDEPRPVSRLASLFRAVDSDPSSDWSVSAMAACVGVSSSRLHAWFLAETGTSPKAWLAQYRLERVQRWLVETDLSLAQIAYRAGFSDQSSLTRAMKKAVGMTPTDYRRKSRESGSKVREF